MIITKKHLSRRTFIRGTFGAAVALPLLECDGAGAHGTIAHGGERAVPVRRDLHAERRLPRHLASRGGGQRLRSSSR